MGDSPRISGTTSPVLHRPPATTSDPAKPVSASQSVPPAPSAANPSRDVQASEIPKTVNDVYIDNVSRYAPPVPTLKLQVVDTDANGIQGPAITAKENLAQYMAAVTAAANAQLQRMYDISSQTGQRVGFPLQYGLAIRETANQGFTLRKGQCDWLDGTFLAAAYVGAGVSTARNTVVLDMWLPGGFMHNFVGNRLSNTSPWMFTIYNKVTFTPSLSLAGATQAFFGNSEMAVVNRVANADAPMRAQFIILSPHRAEMNALSFGGIKQWANPDYGSVKNPNEFNGPAMPTFHERAVAADNNGFYLSLGYGKDGAMQVMARTDPSNGLTRDGIAYDVPVGTQPENGAQFVGGKLTYAQEFGGNGGYSMYGGLEYGKYAHLPNSKDYAYYYIIGLGVDDRHNIINYELDGVSLSTVAPYASLNAGKHFFDFVGGDQPLVGAPNGPFRLSLDGGVDFHGGLPFVTSGQASKDRLSKNTNGNSSSLDSGGLLGDTNLSANVTVRGELFGWLLLSTSARLQGMDPTILPSLGPIPIPFMLGVESSATAVYDKGPLRATLGATYGALTVTERDPKLDVHGSAEVWAGKDWGFGVHAAGGVYRGFETADSMSGGTFLLSSAHVFARPTFMKPLQDTVWKLWGGMNGQGADTNNPMSFSPVFGVAVDLLPQK